MNSTLRSFDDVKINYSISRVKNSELFLVLLHGAGGNISAWNNVQTLLNNSGYSTIVLDLRGHGKSGRPNEYSSYSLESFSKDVYEVLYKEKIKKFILVGHCFGGMVTLMFHKLFPSLAESYILINTSYKPIPFVKKFFGSDEFMNFFNKLVSKFPDDKKLKNIISYDEFIGTSDFDLRRIYCDMVNTSFKSFIYTYETIAGFNGLKILKTIEKPVLIIQGKNDQVFNLSVAKKMHELIKNSKLKIISNANHIIVINNPIILEKTIVQFLRTK